MIGETKITGLNGKGLATPSQFAEPFRYPLMAMPGPSHCCDNSVRNWNGPTFTGNKHQPHAADKVLQLQSGSNRDDIYSCYLGLEYSNRVNRIRFRT